MPTAVPGPPFIRLTFTHYVDGYQEHNKVVLKGGGKIYNGKNGHLYLDFQLISRGKITRYNITEERMELPNDGSMEFLDLKFSKAKEHLYIIKGTLFNLVNEDTIIFYDIYAEFTRMWFQGVRNIDLAEG